MNDDRITPINLSALIRKLIKAYAENNESDINEVCNVILSFSIIKKRIIFDSLLSINEHGTFENAARKILTLEDLYYMAFEADMFFCDDKAMKLYLRLGCDINMIRDKRTLLHEAIYCSSISSMRRVIAHGADVNIRIEGVKTPLELIRCLHENVTKREELIEYAESMAVPFPDVKVAERN